jgi:hypothetical protein
VPPSSSSSSSSSASSAYGQTSLYASTATGEVR